MEKPDDNINNWLKAKIEENPQQPPEAAWQHISESLDLENSWNGIEQDLELDNLWTSIDNRLQLHDQLLWWDKAAKAVTGAMAAVVVMIPLFLQLQTTDTAQLADQQQTTVNVPAEAANSKPTATIRPDAGVTRKHTAPGSAGVDASGIENGSGSATANAYKPAMGAGNAGAVNSARGQEAGGVNAVISGNKRTSSKSGVSSTRSIAGGGTADNSTTNSNGNAAAAHHLATTESRSAEAHPLAKPASRSVTKSGTNVSGTAALGSGNSRPQKGEATGAAGASTAAHDNGSEAGNGSTGNSSAGNDSAHAMAAASGPQKAAPSTTEQQQPYQTLTGIPAELSLAEGVVDVEVVAVATEDTAEETVVPLADKHSPAAGWRVGAGLSGRMSWLMNQKTFSAMDKSTLTTSLPAYRKSFFLQAEKGLSPKLSLLTDIALYSEGGQRYEEYQGGMYGTTDTKLRYSNLSILAAYNPRGRALLQRPHTRFLAGLSGGWLHEANLNGPAGTSNISEEYKKTAAAVILGYEYNFPLSRRVWLNYGIRGQLDILNIYAGSPDIPAKFRQTHSTYLDFVIGFKYEL